ncbi:TIP41-domain-containing protein [Aureobasidium pullulans]|uniref:TIP41-domain-containing protein n=1 Tax=Aureobasidium pullulans TaxID=5580 RepID=A0A4S9E210_AURPU|nr:TIP41-domain-containing protein [Aureobasidium pullulans]
MASNGEQTDSQGVDTFVSRNKQWRVSTRKKPILKAGPIDAMNEKLGIPVPEMIFGDNVVAVEHVPSGWAIDFNAFDALDRVSKTADGMLQVAYSKEWQKDRQHHHEGIKEVVKPFDWSYSTDFKGRTHSPDSSVVWQPTDSSKDPIRTDLLSRPDPILFYDDVIFYEDELADNGIAIFSCKIRVMAERLLLLCRFFLRLDGVIVRVRDTRVYIELGSKTVIRQYTAKEESYDVVQSKLQTHRENIPEVLRDANRIAPLLRTVEDTMDKIVIP